MTVGNAGYVTDIAYTYGAYRELVPTVLGFAVLMAGFEAPSLHGPLSYCELGCGQGFTANMIAAANPLLDVHAMDFIPEHIEGARSLAAAAGLSNVRFYNSDFAAFGADQSLPQFDMITLHGVYSWIAPEHRRSILDIIGRRLKPGGLVYVSYNALPGWAASMPLRQLLVDRAQLASGSTPERIDHALAFVHRLADLDAKHFKANPGARERFDRMKEEIHAYVAHEYFNRHLIPFHHAEVASEMAAAGLSFAGSAHLLDQVGPANFTPEQEAFLSDLPPGSVRETARDFLLDTHFRRDVFIRGARELSLEERDKRWAETRFVLASHRGDINFSATDSDGKARIAAVYNPILDALEDGPRSFVDLAGESALASINRDDLTGALRVLAGTAHLHPALPELGESERRQSATALNSVILNRALTEDRLHYLASPVSGEGIGADRIEQLFLLALRKGDDHPPRFVWNALQKAGHRMRVDDELLDGEDAHLAELRVRFRRFTAKQMPVFDGLGIA